MDADARRRVLWFGLSIRDQALYQRYREAMTPILARHGGRFGYDFTIREVLKSEVEAPIDRVFSMLFPSRAAADGFFADPAYRAVRAELFEPAVERVSALGAYDEDR
ncbi:MAG: DUF1330 domain-containing protein [Minicystis sp.]